MAKDHGSSVKDDEVYEALRREGKSKEQSARIANAAASEGRSDVGARGGRSEPYEEWTKEELEERAREIDIEGRSDLTKDELIEAIRNH
jgi:Rho termination factor, N-terminal domain